MKRRGDIYGLLAEFDTVEALQCATTTLLIYGYRRVRIYTPYPIPEMKGVFRSLVGKMKTFAISPIVFAGGAGGAIAAFALQEYASVFSYPMNVGGRPLNSWPAFVPITFEIAILGAALAAAVAMLILNSLPQFHHPLFESSRFERATQDRFFICVEARDRHFSEEKTSALLMKNAVSVEAVRW